MEIARKFFPIEAEPVWAFLPSLGESFSCGHPVGKEAAEFVV